MVLNKVVAFALSGMVFLCPAYGQTTLGEVLDKGGKKLTREEFEAILPYSSITLWKDGRGESKVVVRPDGTFSGSALHYPSGKTSGSFGTWKFDEAGRYCYTENLPGFSLKSDYCYFRFQIGQVIFNFHSDSDRSAEYVQRITLTK